MLLSKTLLTILTTSLYLGTTILASDPDQSVPLTLVFHPQN